MPQAALIGSPGIEAIRRFAHGPLQLGIGNGWGNGDRYRLSNLVLHDKNVGWITVVSFRPQMIARLGVD